MEEPVLVRIRKIVIVEYSKYFICNKLDTVCFENHIICFQVVVPKEIIIIKPSCLAYVWPQRLYEQVGLKFVVIQYAGNV